MKTVDSLFRKRQREGSGSVFLRRKAATMNPATQSLLAELLEWSPTTKQDETDNHDADKDDTDKCKNEPTEDTAPLFSTERFFLHGWNPKDDGKQIVDVSGTDDEEVLRLALHNKIALLPSILKVFVDNPASPHTARSIVRSCLLLVNPGSVLAAMDAKEVILAALQFLSSALSLLIVTTQNDDLEKRSYQKSGPWSLKDKLPMIRQAECVFSEMSPWARVHACPPLGSQYENLLLAKGSVPVNVISKKKATKRKATPVSSGKAAGGSKAAKKTVAASDAPKESSSNTPTSQGGKVLKVVPSLS